MRFRGLLVIVLGWLMLGCTGDGTLPGNGPLPDDDLTDDDDAADDDDDDDDAADDDDSQPSQWGDAFGVWQLVGTIQHPQGRAMSGLGYYVIEQDEARGPGDYGCDVRLPSDDAARGDIETLDIGEWAQFSGESANGAPWLYTLDRVEDGDRVYYVSGSGNPTSMPPGSLLDFEAPGGEDLPAVTISQALRTVEIFDVLAPVLEPTQEIVYVNAAIGLPFEWTAQGSPGLEIVIALFSDDGSRSWVVTCWVEDTGSFHLGPELLSELPREVVGLAWVRRYLDAWHPKTDEYPDTLMQGALQHRYFVSIYDDTDG
jgi:hypothetical protein